MYIKLTNASPAHVGNKIAINTDLIATVHDAVVTRESGISEKITFIFCPPHGTWEVSETVDNILLILNGLQE